MLFCVETENFFSVAQQQDIDFSLRAGVPTEARFAPIYPGSEKRAPQVVAVFGPNASGKSVWLRAIAFLAWFARESFQIPPDRPLPASPFASQRWKQRPTRLAVEIGAKPLFPATKGEAYPPGVYRYELELQSEGGPFFFSWVAREALFYRPHKARKRFRVFERKKDGTVQGSPLFPTSPFRRTAAQLIKVRPNASVIATYAQFGHVVARKIQEALRGISSNLLLWKEEIRTEQLAWLFQNAELLEAANRELRRLDLGLDRLKFAEDGKGLIFVHQGLDEEVPWVLESHGTQSFLLSFPHLWLALKTGGIAVLDELDASIHPDILREVVSWFWDPKRNPQNAQLFFSCHNSLMLRELQKEEILLCQKTVKAGNTRIYRLADVRGVRRREDFLRGYLHGAYGAVPNIG